jgi:hypothetical protein
MVNPIAYQIIVIHHIAYAFVYRKFFSADLVLNDFCIELLNHQNSKDSRNDIHLSETAATSKINSKKKTKHDRMFF